ncbi:MAG: monovalent cation/H+ antiporter complex subunit F [Gemmatimonadota bacterium]
MSQLFLGTSIFLLVTLLGGMQRIVRGPRPADRLLAAQLFGTTGVAILLLLAEAYDAPAVRDVALVAALLAVVNVAAFVHGSWTGETDE